MFYQAFNDNDIKGKIGEVVVSGSRCRGLENDNSNIDVVVEIKGSELKKDALFNIFHEEEMEIDGITVDINPVRTSWTTYVPIKCRFCVKIKHKI